MITWRSCSHRLWYHITILIMIKITGAFLCYRIYFTIFFLWLIHWLLCDSFYGCTCDRLRDFCQIFLQLFNLFIYHCVLTFYPKGPLATLRKFKTKTTYCFKNLLYLRNDILRGKKQFYLNQDTICFLNAESFVNEMRVWCRIF